MIVDLFNQPLRFKSGVAYCRTFQGKLVRVFLNQTKRPSRLFGYAIIDDDFTVIKFCRGCSVQGLKRAVILN